MPASVNRARLLALSDKEFRSHTAAPESVPADSSFRPILLKLTRYDEAWDRKRGAAARMMAVLLRENDSELTQRVCESAASLRTYAGAADWLSGEAVYLRKVASQLETAAGRVRVVLQRCNSAGAAASTPSAMQP